MIIGAIEYCSQQEVSGWIYSPVNDLKGKPVLAFLNGKCVGAGEIGNFRQDLEDAGLGDGHYGYHFWITLPPFSDTKALIITLQNCEAFLKQKDAVIGSGLNRAGETLLCGAVPSTAQLAWLCDKGVTDAQQVATLRNLAAFGAAQHICEIASAEQVSPLMGLLETVALGPVALAHVDLVTGPEFREQLLAHPEAQKAGLFVLQSEARCSLLVREVADGHLSPEVSGAAISEMEDFGAVAYFCDAQTSLVLRRGTPFKVKAAMTSETVRCYFPVSLDANNGDTAALRRSGAALHLQDSVLK